MAAERDRWNACRYRPEDAKGHYESYFQRANHPSRPLAFWIRYTLFSPKGRPDAACGELWAICFDGEQGRITAVKESLPLAQCSFSTSHLAVRIGSAELTEGLLSGAARSADHAISWTLRYDSPEPPLLLLDRGLYERSFPRAKVLTGSPNARFDGTLVVDGEEVPVDGWRGSQNHNWGSRHTDHYAWAQVAGFDDAREAFFECSTVRVRIGPVWSPWLTTMVLRMDGEEYRLNTILQMLRAEGRFRPFTWSFSSRAAGASIRGRVDAPATAFVGLRYANPPGGEKICLNSKLARCELTIERVGHAPRVLTTSHRAAFEILSDRAEPGVPVVA